MDAPPEMTNAQTPIAQALSAGSRKVVMMIESAAGAIIAPPVPCNARAAQRPEQVSVVVLVAREDAAVREDDRRSEEMIGGQAMFAAEDAEPAAEREAGDPDGRSVSGRDRQSILVQSVVHVAEPGPRADGRDAVRDRYRAHRAHVYDDPFGRRAAGEAVSSAANGGPQPIRRADEIASETSSGASHSTTACGRMSWKRAIAGFLAAS